VKLTGKPADRSRTVYHSKNTIRHGKHHSIIKKEENGRSSVNTPNNDSILRMLRMRHGRNVVEFLRQEFEKRNSPPHSDAIDLVKKCQQLPESPTSLTDQKKDDLQRHSLPEHGITLTD
jgi:hypothetical protein